LHGAWVQEQGLLKRESGEKSLRTGSAYFVRLVDDCPFSDHAFRLTRAGIQVGGLFNVNRRAAHHDGHEILQQREKGTHSMQMRGMDRYCTDRINL
jgi:hypothetical protein